MTTTDESKQNNEGGGKGQKESGQTSEKNGNPEKTNVSKEEGNSAKKKFHLTPEEQELAYELRANVSHRTHEQNTRLNHEMAMHRNLQEMRRRQQERVYSTRIEPDEKLSRLNAIKLMRMYERRAKEAEMRASQLESELRESEDLAKRYHDMYLQERSGAGDRPRSRLARSETKSPRKEDPSPDGEKGKKENTKEDEKDKKGKESEKKKEEPKPMQRSKSAKPCTRTAEPHEESPRAKTAQARSRENGEKVTEKDLDDDEAMFKRHVEMIAETGAMKTTSPIRVADVVRKSECLIRENEQLKREVKRLTFDNSELVKRVKSCQSDRIKLMNCIGTSEMARADLMKRLSQEKQKHQRLNRSLTRQASDWIQYRKDLQEADEKRRWAQVGYNNTQGAEERTFSHPVKKNVYKPRGMFPVEQYASTNSR